MSTEVNSNLQLEIGHVLFIDVVGYSKRLIDDQRELQQQLNEIVRGTGQFRTAEAAGKLVRLPTGDGMALVFFTSPESPVQCALEISEALQSHPQLRVRMGINSGPVSGVADVNERSNVAGTGINMAQRLMDIGDAGHILLSRRAAEDLVQYRHWEPHLHNLGEFEVKHGVKISVINLYTEKLGNPQIPEKLRQFSRKQAATRRLKRTLIAALLFLAVALPAGALIILRRTPVKLTTSRATLIPEKSIAVLPFENLSANQENAFFTDGVQDEILADLAKVADLKVISRTSVMLYKSGNPRNLREIGQQLGVAHVLEGSVQRSANRIRVTAQLIDARSDAHLWAQTYDRDLADVFAIQSEIAEAIADQLRAKISPGEKAAIARAPTTDLSANALYVQAKELEFKAPQQQSLLQAVHLLEEAVARDPRFMLAYCMLGRLHLELYWGGYDHTPARRELANTAIQNAVRLQPDAGEVHLALAWYAYQGFRDYDRARAELDLARRTLPNNADIYYVTALIDRRQGRWAEATRNLERAVELDPRNFGILEETADTYRGLRRYSDAIRLAERALAVSPRDYFARILRALLPFFERADIGPLRTELSAILTEEPGPRKRLPTFCSVARWSSAILPQPIARWPPSRPRGSHRAATLFFHANGSLALPLGPLRMRPQREPPSAPPARLRKRSHAINPITRRPGAFSAESTPLSGERRTPCAKDAALASCCHCPRMLGQARG